MRAMRLAALLMFGVTAIGCGGMSACGGADFGTGNIAYAGSYTGTFQNAADPILSFTVTLDNSGQVSGTVTEAGTSRTAPVSGYLID